MRKKKKDPLTSVVHLRISRKSHGLFKERAKEMRVPVGTYVRIFIDDMLTRYKSMPTIGTKEI